MVVHRVLTSCVAACCLPACSELPAVEYESDRVRVAPYFDEPVCAGSLATMESWLERLESNTGLSVDEPVTFYWGPDAIDPICDGARGCSFPHRREIFGLYAPLEHELAHVVGATVGESPPLLEEGWAEALTTNCAGIAPEAKLELAELAADAIAESGDVARAAHFLMFLMGRYGVESVVAFKDAAHQEVDAEALGEAFVQEFGEAFDDVVAQWQRSPREVCQQRMSPRDPFYFGGELRLAFAPACDDPTTHGPYEEAYTVEHPFSTDILPGMYQRKRLTVPFATYVDVELTGPDNAWLTFLRHSCWGLGNTRYRIAPGEVATLTLGACIYDVFVGSDDYEPFEATVTIRERVAP